MLANLINSIIKGVMAQVTPRLNGHDRSISDIKNDIVVIKSVTPSLRADITDLQTQMRTMSASSVTETYTQAQIDTMVQNAMTTALAELSQTN